MVEPRVIAVIVLGLLSIIFAKTIVNLPGSPLKAGGEKVFIAWTFRFFGVFLIFLGLLTIFGMEPQFNDFLDRILKRK